VSAALKEIPHFSFIHRFCSLELFFSKSCFGNIEKFAFIHVHNNNKVLTKHALCKKEAFSVRSSVFFKEADKICTKLSLYSDESTKLKSKKVFNKIDYTFACLVEFCVHAKTGFRNVIIMRRKENRW
jgi:hypothetical protein